MLHARRRSASIVAVTRTDGIPTVRRAHLNGMPATRFHAVGHIGEQIAVPKVRERGSKCLDERRGAHSIVHGSAGPSGNGLERAPVRTADEGSNASVHGRDT